MAVLVELFTRLRTSASFDVAGTAKFSTATQCPASASNIVMSPVSTMPADDVRARHKGQRSGRLPLIVIVVAACVALSAIALGLSRQWPLAQARVLQDLREASDSEVKVRAFHERYFPTPGCIMEGVVFHHGNAEAKPLMTIEKVTIRASYLGLLSQRVSRITAELEPFFKKKRKGEMVPVRRSGTFEHPTFGLDLNDEKAEKVAAP